MARFAIDPRWCALLLLALTTLLSPTANAQQFDSDNMVLLSHEDQFLHYIDIWGFVGNDSREYIIQALHDGTAWWDVTDPIHPVFLKKIGAIPSAWRDMFVIGNYAYMVSESSVNGIQIFNLTNPQNPVPAGVYTTTVANAHNIYGDPARNLLFVVGATFTSNGGVIILDASNPTSLVEVGRWDNRYVHDLWVDGTDAFACLSGTGKLRPLDFTDPTSPASQGTNFSDFISVTHAVWGLGDGIHVAMTNETGGGHLRILDVSDLSAISVVGAYNPIVGNGFTAHNPHMAGDKLYVSWYRQGIRVVDVADPTNPTGIGHFDTWPDDSQGGMFSGCWGVYPHLPSGTVAANDGVHGMFLLQYDADAARLDGSILSSEGGSVPGATVEYLNHDITQAAGSAGEYRFAVFPGASHTIRASAFGFESDSVTVAVGANGTTSTDITLTKLPSGGLGGVVTDAGTSLPIEGAEVEIVGTPLATTTDASGAYSFPEVPAGNVDLVVRHSGYHVATATSVGVPDGSAATRDFGLPAASIYVDFSDPTGWTVTNDPGTTAGFWEFSKPQGTWTLGIPFQTDKDHSDDPEDQCAVTQNASGPIFIGDVDGGATYLHSPVYDLSAMTEPHVFYYRWYAVNDIQDDWVVEVTDNGGISYTELERQTDWAAWWTPRDFDLTGLLTNWANVQFRFTAQDQPVGGGQLVEAALDDFVVYDDAGAAVGAPWVDSRGPVRLELSQSAPNPFRDATEIHFAIPDRRHVEMSVFDVRGARVAVLVDNEFDAGSYSTTWDGLDRAGRRVAPGIYFYTLNTGTEVRTRKLVRVH